MGEGSVTQSRHLQVIEERDMYKKMCEDIVYAVLNEGAFPRYHKSLLKKHRSEWPFLWKRIDVAIGFVKEQKIPKKENS